MCNASLGLIEEYYEKGRIKGFEIGIELGIAQVIASEKAKHEAIMNQTILNLHNINISIKDIASCTNRSIEEVQAIIDENNN